MMKKYVVGVFPSSTSTDLKMSRDVIVDAESHLMAQELVQGMYPDAKVMVRRELPAHTENPSLERVSSEENSAAYVGHLFGKYIKASVTPHVQKVFETSDSISGLISVSVLIALMVLGVSFFGVLGVLLPFVLFWVLDQAAK